MKSQPLPKRPKDALATFSSKRSEPAQEGETQGRGRPDLAGARHRRPSGIAQPLNASIFIRALNFPETENDTEGFNALRMALKDRSTRRLMQASQDVLTLLSQEGIYMDDLRPDMARPEIWRQFAQGARGRAVASPWGHSRPVLAGADGGTDEAGPDLSATPPTISCAASTT